MSIDQEADPHADQPVLQIGAPLDRAAGAVIMLHGRGASAEDILNLAQAMYHPRLAYLAPESEGHAWYPYTFLSSREKNEPWLSSALKKVKSTIQMAKDAGISSEHIIVCGFSQGACLSIEYVATHPERYAGLLAFTGGLIGPLDMVLAYSGDLRQTPAFLGSGDHDPFIPWERVRQSAYVLAGMNAQVTLQCYPGRAHTVSSHEVQFANRLIAATFGSPGEKT